MSDQPTLEEIDVGITAGHSNAKGMVRIVFDVWIDLADSVENDVVTDSEPIGDRTIGTEGLPGILLVAIPEGNHTWIGHKLDVIASTNRNATSRENHYIVFGRSGFFEVGMVLRTPKHPHFDRGRLKYHAFDLHNGAADRTKKTEP